MKTMRQDKYPHSATLFRFCKRALEMRYAGNVKVIDQDVGSILGYDPADCSHWKKGKKNIKALGVLKSIAEHLSIDDRLLVGITTGEVSLEEALFEYQGYGDFSFSESNLDTLKKDYFKFPERWAHTEGGGLISFEELFKVDREYLSQLAKSFLGRLKPFALPISVEEVYGLFESAELVWVPEDLTKLAEEGGVSSSSRGKLMTFKLFKSEPSFMKFLAVKELYKHLCFVGHPMMASRASFPNEVLEIESNIFAGLILIPREKLVESLSELDISKDFIKQLADKFGVSLAFMNKRLGYFMAYSA